MAAVSEGLEPKVVEIATSQATSAHYSSTKGAQFINSTVTGNTFIWQNHPAKPQTLSSWFSNIKYWLHHIDARKDLLKDSGSWLLERNEFKEWKSSPRSSVLWLHGIPGSGKTKLVAQVINNLEPSLPAGSFAYFYCLRSAAEDERSRPEELIRSILRQLAFYGTETKVLKAAAAKKYELKEKDAKKHCSEEVDNLTLQECVLLLIELLEGTSTFIVIDALDELKKDDRWIFYEAFDKILDELDTGIVRIFISSREDGDIKMKLSCYPNVYIKATDNGDDVRQFVLQEVDKAIKNCRLLRGNISEELKRDIVTNLNLGAQGMFRWVSLQIQALCSPHLKTISAVRKALGKLPKTLEESYDVVYQQMLDTDPETRRKSEIIIQFLLCARRQLKTPEFIAAVYARSSSIEDISPVDTNGELLSVEEILDICCNLIVWDQSVDTFRAAHLSVREYFERKPRFEKQKIHSEALEACINTLLLETNQEPIATFKLYATTYWPNHCFELGLQGPTGSLRDKVMLFLFNGYSASSFYLDWAHSLDPLNLARLESDQSIGSDQSLRSDQVNRSEQAIRLQEAYSVLNEARGVSSGLRSIVFLASAFNLPWMLMPWMQNEIPSDVPFDHRTILNERPGRDSAIAVAAVWGSLEVARKLVDYGADVNAKGLLGWAPLHRAAQNRSRQVAKALIEAGANLNVVSGDGRQFTPLHEAIWNEDPGVVRLLLEHGANIESRDNFGLTPLLLAVNQGKEEVIPVLLQWNADMSATDGHGDTAFYLAAERHESIFIIFIQSGKIPEKLFGGSVLCSAVRSCSRKSVQTLLAKGIDVNEPDRFEILPLDYALEQGFSEVISLLISHAARTALNWKPPSYYIQQWRSEAWFPDLIQSLVIVSAAKPAPYIFSTLPNKVCREEYIEIVENSPRVPYLWIRIPQDFTPVRRIEFTTESHDQGFSNDADQWKGTYANSWTWFEVAILPCQSSRSTGSLRCPPPRRHLQSNLHAIWEFKIHKNAWDENDENDEIREWLSFLRFGDVVQLSPRALYPAWVNYIKGAEIEIFGGASMPMAIRPALNHPRYATAGSLTNDPR